MISFFEYLKAVLFGIVEGITEWLPISSTGHMILLDEFVHLSVSNNAQFNEKFYSMFEVVIQLGAILAVILLFFRKLNPFALSKSKEEKLGTWILWLKVIIAVLPSAVIGFLVDDWCDANLYNYVTVAITLVLYGVAFILVERRNERLEIKPACTDVNTISYKTALLVGAFQVLAIIPGTSRSGTTILGGILLGLSRTAASEFSFFLAIPTMVGASLLRGYKFFDYISENDVAVPAQAWIVLAVGCAVAFVVSLVAIKFLMAFVKKHTFSSFGVYRIALGALVLLYFLVKLFA